MEPAVSFHQEIRYSINLKIKNTHACLISVIIVLCDVLTTSHFPSGDLRMFHIKLEICCFRSCTKNCEKY